MATLPTLALALAAQLPTAPVPLIDAATGPADGFGASVAIDGDLAVVGSPENVGNAFASYGAGVVTVYRRVQGDWQFEARLTAAGGASRDGFGAAVDVDRGANGVDVIVVGAPLTLSSFRGRLHVFERAVGGPWTEVFAVDGDAARDRFAWDVAVENGVVAAGQPDFEGGVHLFERTGPSTWISAGEAPRPSTVFSSAEFGQSVALDGDLLVVGAPGEDSLGYDSGAAYVYRRQSGATFVEEARLEHPSAATVTGHATAVDVDAAAGHVAIGSRDRRAFAWTRGANGWMEVDVLLPFDGEDDGFGESIAVAGGRIVVGAHRRLGTGPDSGAALEFVRDGLDWTPRSLVHPTFVEDGAFATSVALGGGTLVVGAPRDDANGLDAGAAFAVEIDRRIGASHCAGRRNSTGGGAALVARGSASIAADDLGFDVVGLPVGSTGFLLAAQTRAQVPMLGGGDGDLCLGGSISRIYTVTGVAGGGGTRSFDVVQSGLPPSFVPAPGASWSFQYWYRDATPGATSNTTHAVEVVFE